jgi:hypothetical protein
MYLFTSETMPTLPVELLVKLGEVFSTYEIDESVAYVALVFYITRKI